MSGMFLEPQTGVSQAAEILRCICYRKGPLCLNGCLEPKGIVPGFHRGKQRGRPNPGTPSTANKDAGKWQHNKQHPIYRSFWNAHVLPGEFQGPPWKPMNPKVQATKKQIWPTRSSQGLEPVSPQMDPNIS